MQEKQQGPIVRRSRVEVAQLVAEYESGILSRDEFCQKHGLTVATLRRYRLRRQRKRKVIAPSRLIAVELTEAKPADPSATSIPLSVVLRTGRRIEVNSGVDASLFSQIVQLLEKL
jgi:hypothetical protein